MGDNVQPVLWAELVSSREFPEMEQFVRARDANATPALSDDDIERIADRVVAKLALVYALPTTAYGSRYLLLDSALHLRRESQDAPTSDLSGEDPRGRHEAARPEGG